MKVTHWTFLLNVFLKREGSAQDLDQEKNDHLTCFKIASDSDKGLTPSFNFKLKMQANMVQREKWSLRNCKVKKAKRFCVPSTKRVTPVTDSTGSTGEQPDPTLGDMVDAYDPNRCIQNDLLCYLVKCKKKKRAPQAIKDQFNTNATDMRKIELKFINKFEICTPTWKIDAKGKIIENAPCPYCCEETDKCKLNGGKCVRDCVKSKTMNCWNMCKKGTDCKCAIPKCPYKKKCKKNGGKCVKNCKETDEESCKDLCDPKNESPDKCMCKIPTPIICEPFDDCKKANGICVPKADCVAIFDQISCRDICDKKTCVCKIENSSTDCVENPSCERNGGKCKKDCQDTDELICEDWCDPTIDNPDKCMCEVKRTPCVLTNSCRENGGKCKKDCKDTDTLICTDICLRTVDDPKPCMCEMKKTQCEPNSVACRQAGGECEKDCTDTDKHTCENMCKNILGDPDPCMCKVKRTSCSITTDTCRIDYGGVCKRDCEDTATIRCEDVCLRFADDPNGCKCWIEKNTCTQIDDLCAQAGGDCEKDCTDTDEYTCETNMCKTNPIDPCMCKVKRTTKNL